MDFKYLECLFPEDHDRWKAVFKGRTLKDDEGIIIKFTNSYCVKAHRILEKKSLAPKHRRFFSRDHEGFRTVVVDLVETDSRFGSPNLTDNQRKEIHDAIKLLHAEGHVLGDLRKSNILSLRLRGNHAMLPDFDWSQTGAGSGGK